MWLKNRDEKKISLQKVLFYIEYWKFQRLVAVEIAGAIETRVRNDPIWFTLNARRGKVESRRRYDKFRASIGGWRGRCRRLANFLLILNFVSWRNVSGNRERARRFHLSLTVNKWRVIATTTDRSERASERGARARSPTLTE